MAIEGSSGFYHMNMTTENTKQSQIGSDSVFTEVVAHIGSIVDDDGVIASVSAIIDYMYPDDPDKRGSVEDTWANSKVKAPDEFDSDALDEMCLMVRKLMESLSTITAAGGILLKIELDILYTKDDVAFTIEYDPEGILEQADDDDEEEDEDDE